MDCAGEGLGMDVKSLLTENVEGRDGRNESTLTSMSLGSSMEGGGEKSMGFSPLSSIGFLLNDEDEVCSWRPAEGGGKVDFVMAIVWETYVRFFF